MDPPPRSLARRSVSLLHGRGPLDPTDYKRVARFSAHTGRLPSDHPSSPRSYSMPPCSRPSRTSPFGGAEEAPSLTAAALRRLWHLVVGAEESPRRGSNKRNGQRKPRRKAKVVLRPP